jgi:tetratricopeptide (TPR) repeat protein
MPGTLLTLFGPRAERALQASLVALLVVGTLTLSDAPPSQGLFYFQAMLWGAFALGGMAWIAVQHGKKGNETPRGAWDYVDFAAAAYLGWTAVSTFAVWRVGDLRSAVNGLFQTFGLVAAIIVGRRLFAELESRQRLTAIMFGLAVTLAGIGCVERLVTYPARQAQIEEDANAYVMELGFAPGSLEAERALQRALSPEPQATFSLTSSLAAVLTPWLVVSLALAFWSLPDLFSGEGVTSTRRLAGPAAWLVVAAAAMAVCLWLTQVRTAMVATGAGVVLLAVIHLGIGQRMPRWWWGGSVAGFLLLAMIAGWLTPWRAAPYAMQQRVLAWQSSAAMIIENPLTGTGPGSFGSGFPRHMAPETADTIASPENFLFELAATLGVPGLLIFVGLLALVMSAPPATAEAREVDIHDSNQQSAWLLSGAAGGLLLTWLMAWMLGLSEAHSYRGFFGVPLIFLVGFPALALSYFLFPPLLARLASLDATLRIAIVALLICLLMMGGISYPNVALSLAALVLLSAPVRLIPAEEPVDRRSAGVAYAGLAIAALSALLCYFTCYIPVMNAQWYLQLSEQAEGDPFAMMDSLEMAGNADPWDPEPAAIMAQLQWQLFASQARSEALPVLEETLASAIARDSRSPFLWQQAGDIYLGIYRVTDNGAHLQQAISHYRRAIERFPTSAPLHARLAWTLRLAEDPQSAEAAREALRLDEATPHRHRKLARFELPDPGLSPRERAVPVDELMRALAR